MKRFLTVCLCLVMAIGVGVGLTACGSEGQVKSDVMTAAAKDFYQFIMSKEGQAVVSSEGLVGVEGKAYGTARNTVSGKVNLVGSTSVQPVIKLLAEEYEKYQRDVEISVSGTGSSQGREEAKKGYSNTFGLVSAELSDEQLKEFTELKIATDGIAVIGHKNNPATNLLKSDVAEIFKGAKTSWADFGGEGSIILNQREDGSGTRSAFEEIFNIKGLVPAAAGTHTSTGAMRTTVAGHEKSIGYVSAASVDSSVKAFSVDGIACTTENIKSGAYTVARPFSLVVLKTMDIAK